MKSKRKRHWVLCRISIHGTTKKTSRLLCISNLSWLGIAVHGIQMWTDTILDVFVCVGETFRKPGLQGSLIYIYFSDHGHPSKAHFGRYWSTSKELHNWHSYVNSHKYHIMEVFRNKSTIVAHLFDGQTTIQCTPLKRVNLKHSNTACDASPQSYNTLGLHCQDAHCVAMAYRKLFCYCIRSKQNYLNLHLPKACTSSASFPL